MNMSNPSQDTALPIGSEGMTWTDVELMSMLEALLFVAGEPLELALIVKISGSTAAKVQECLQQLALKYKRDPQAGLCLREVEGKFCLGTKALWGDYCALLFTAENLPPLTPAAYEVLAAILYNQPVTRAQIEEVRGVNSDSIVSRLEERGLVEQCGVLEQVGRPALFKLSEKCLLQFGFSSAADLPATELMMYASIRKLEEE